MELGNLTHLADHMTGIYILTGCTNGTVHVKEAEYLSVLIIFNRRIFT